MPTADESVKKFEDWSKMQSPHFVMYADIEAIFSKPQNPNSTILQQHEPCAVGSYIVPHKDLTYPAQNVKFHEGRGCVEEFCRDLEQQCRDFYVFGKQNCNKPQQRTDMTELIYETATECEYCKVEFRFVEKVRHHDHVSGEQIAVICQACNSKIRQPIAYLPVFFHNLKNYDMHHLCLEEFSNMPHWTFKPIATTQERYITLTAKFKIDRDAGNKPIFYEVRFIDLYQFLATSLDNLSSNLDTAKKIYTVRPRNTYPVDNDILFKKG
ncbi:MAG TPA: hypothetical protein VEP90_29535, partial [Methylomirabilota bacterium]|nr:hypothetical protein [Methylomirabilota bacterium]